MLKSLWKLIAVSALMACFAPRSIDSSGSASAAVQQGTFRSKVGGPTSECDPRRGKLKCSNFSFSGDWSRVNFSKADLRNSDFEEGASFRYANFSGAALDGVDMRSRRAKSAPIGDDFDSDYGVCTNYGCPGVVDLRNANFQGASLREVYLGGAVLTGARFDKAWLPNLHFSPLSNNERLDMKFVSFVDAYMEDVEFYQVDLSGANFRGSRLSRATIVSTILNKTNFTSAMLERASFTNSSLNQTNFTSAILINARMTNSSMSQVNFSKAVTSGIILPKNCKIKAASTSCR